MKESIILFETAKLAKMKGFNWINKSEYHIDILGGHEYYDFKTSIHDRVEERILAPTQSLLQKWLREEHSIFIDFITITTSNEVLGFDVRLRSWRFSPIHVCCELNYEKALEKALYKALEIIP